MLSFKEWFKAKTPTAPLLDRILEILRAPQTEDEERAADVALSHLDLQISEELVLQVFSHAKGDVLSCLKFFDWAGRQPGFNHTRVTFHAIFKILSKAKLMSLMFDFLDSNLKKQIYGQKVRLCDILVMGYAVAGRPDTALQLFGRMRFRGLDLDSFAYHVLLNALVEGSCFDAVDIIFEQISRRGFDCHVTHSIMMKSFCRQNRLGEAEEYIRGLLSRGEVIDDFEYGLGFLVDALCKKNMMECAGRLLVDFKESGSVRMGHAYGIWLRALVLAGNLDGALDFLQRKKSLEGYIPDVFRYNSLVCQLLKDNKLTEVADILLEMKENHISPDEITMNAVLCFFCKAGMVDIALDLYQSRSEFGLTPNGMAYNYLISTLCGDGSVDEAYHVLKHSIDQGHFPGRRTFSIIANALCKEGKLDKMKELVLVALERNIKPSDSTYDKFITALCNARRVEDGYLIHGELNRTNRVAKRSTYFHLINGFNKSSRGDIASRLLIEMQDKGHPPTRSLFRAVIRCLCGMENPENQFLRLLEMQLSHREPNCLVYNFFIDGAGYARRPELARKVFEMMRRSGIEPFLSSKILMLQSYLKNYRISDALNFFSDLRQQSRIEKKLYNTMIVGLCKVNKGDIALHFLKEMRDNGLVPSTESYECLIQLLCANGEYDMAINLVNDLEKAGRHITSFIGNTLLWHSLKSQALYEAWLRLRDVHDETSVSLSLGHLIKLFSGGINIEIPIEKLEAEVEQCFRLDIYTYNILLKRVSMSHVDHACQIFDRICQRGYEPNQWTYDILVHGLFRNGRIAEAKNLVEEMFQKGFDLTDRTKLLV